MQRCHDARWWLPSITEKLGFPHLFPLFGCLTADQNLRLEQRASPRLFAADQMIYCPSDGGQSVHLLVRGRVKIKVLTPDGREIILAFVDEGELFGEHALIDSSSRNEFAEATTPVAVMSLPREELLWLISQNASLGLEMTKLIGLRRRRIENRLRNVLFRSTRQRVAALLLELLESHGEPLKRGWRVRLPLSHQELANLIGATRETVTVVLGRLKAEGTIEVRRRRLVVLDRERLANEDAAASAPRTGSPD
jgi:CRP-like cAMP-binding protein